MAKVRPIRGQRYSEKIADKNLVVAPPYDVISKEDQIRLHARHPKNIVWIDYGMEKKGESEEKYERAHSMIKEFIFHKVIVKDENPSFYYYEQEFAIEGRERLTRSGFICGLLLEKFGEGSVFRHERTLLAPKIDRLNLMKHTGMATSPIFGIYEDDENVATSLFQREVAEKEPDTTVVDDGGVCHRLWVLDDGKLIENIVDALKGRKVFIADGHHRYETALAYRDWMRERAGDSPPSSSWNYVLIFLSASGDEGLVILPTHRGVYGLDGDKVDTLIEGLKNYFTVEEGPDNTEDLVRQVSKVNEGERRIGLMDRTGKNFVLKIGNEGATKKGDLSFLPPAMRDLDVSLLHGIILERILGISPEEITSGRKVRFYKDMKKGLQDLEKADIQLFFLLNPISMKQFLDVSRSGYILPQKTTYFYPKILTGLVLFPVEEKDRVG